MLRVLTRRPEVLFGAALLVLATTLVLQRWSTSPSPRVAIDTTVPPPAAVPLSDPNTIAGLQSRIRRDPNDTGAYVLLGWGLLQQVRETADATLYTQAGQAFDEALKREPNQVDALIGQGALALSRHDFADALAWGERARALNPQRAQIYGVIGDAQIELGRYDEAADTIQTMIDLRPDLGSYSRAAYIHELNGDIPAAIKAMELAISAGGPATENSLWTQVQLGNLYFNRGDLDQAEAAYASALTVRASYPYAQAGIARVLAARGRTGEAIALYKQVVERLPLPEFAIALGDLQQATGDGASATQQYDLVRAIQQLNAAAGMNVDMELALFEAEHGDDPAKAVALARAAYAKRPGIYGADALAWALYHAGSYAGATRYSDQALQLGTRDAALHFRAGMIAAAAGNQAKARTELQQALAINPHFSPRYAPQAHATLAQLGKE